MVTVIDLAQRWAPMELIATLRCHSAMEFEVISRFAKIHGFVIVFVVMPVIQCFMLPSFIPTIMSYRL